MYEELRDIVDLVWCKRLNEMDVSILGFLSWAAASCCSGCSKGKAVVSGCCVIARFVLFSFFGHLITACLQKGTGWSLMGAVPLADGHCCHTLGLPFACIFHLCIFRGRFLNYVKVSMICYIANHFKDTLKIFTMWSTPSCFFGEVSHCAAYWDCS